MAVHGALAGAVRPVWPASAHICLTCALHSVLVCLQMPPTFSSARSMRVGVQCPAACEPPAMPCAGIVCAGRPDVWPCRAMALLRTWLTPWLSSCPPHICSRENRLMAPHPSSHQQPQQQQQQPSVAALWGPRLPRQAPVFFVFLSPPCFAPCPAWPPLLSALTLWPGVWAVLNRQAFK